MKTVLYAAFIAEFMVWVVFDPRKVDTACLG
jgi:hypothetical protein